MIEPTRRAAPRHDLTIEAIVTSDAHVVLCAITNLSRGGAFASAPRLPIGSRALVMFQLPTLDVSLELGAVVRWATDRGVGLQFDGLRARETRALDRYLESLA